MTLIIDRDRLAIEPGQEDHHDRSQDLDASVRHIAAPIRQNTERANQHVGSDSETSAVILRVGGFRCNENRHVRRPFCP